MFPKIVLIPISRWGEYLSPFPTAWVVASLSVLALWWVDSNSSLLSWFSFLWLPLNLSILSYDYLPFALFCHEWPPWILVGRDQQAWVSWQAWVCFRNSLHLVPGDSWLLVPFLPYPSPPQLSLPGTGFRVHRNEKLNHVLLKAPG